MTYQPIGNGYQQTETVYTQQAHHQPVYQEQVVHTTHVVGNNTFWNKKVGQSAQCQYCHANMVTYTRMEDGLFTYLACGGTFMMGFVCGCCLIPFFIDDLKNTNHYCSACHSHIGTKPAF